jgi:hypothetical protein
VRLRARGAHSDPAGVARCCAGAVAGPRGAGAHAPDGRVGRQLRPRAVRRRARDRVAVRSVAHSDLTPGSATSGAFAFGLKLLGHLVGWGYPRGGAGRLADALLERLAELGAEVRCGAHAEEILVRDPTVRGVRLRSGEELSADAVISAVSAAPLATMLPLTRCRGGSGGGSQRGDTAWGRSRSTLPSRAPCGGRVRWRGRPASCTSGTRCSGRARQARRGRSAWGTPDPARR